MAIVDMDGKAVDVGTKMVSCAASIDHTGYYTQAQQWTGTVAEIDEENGKLRFETDNYWIDGKVIGQVYAVA